MTETNGFSALGRRLRLGMVGGGTGSLIGPVHRMAARLDDRYELVAAALSSDPERAAASATELGIASERSYENFSEMAETEAARDDGIDVVAIVTPNHLHYAPACTFLDNGIDVICDKPLTNDLDEAVDLVRRVRASDRVFALTHAYAAYPLVRHARERIAAGDLGEVRVVQVEYPQQSYAGLTEDGAGNSPAWRRDPARSGPGGCIADIGTHAHHLASWVTGLELSELCAEISTFVPGGRVDDDNNILLRYENGARGMLWASKIATGCRNGLRLRVFGTKAGLFWGQEDPNEIEITQLGGERRILGAGSPDLGPAARRATRLKSGHPEGLIEAFANIYADVADVVAARLTGGESDPLALDFPDVVDGARGVKFIEAALESARRGGVWVEAKLAL